MSDTRLRETSGEPAEVVEARARRRARGVVRNVRQRCGERIWNLGRWVYDYWPHDLDEDDDRAWWTMSATFQGTEAEADKAFERLGELACGYDHHPLALCNFRVGGMHRLSDAEVNGEDENDAA